VIIDVGVQILDISYQDAAHRWLTLRLKQDIEAAVFYDDEDEAMVMDREGYVEKPLASPFRQQLGICLVFLDHQHTRGIDLKG
jgi:hypothetical protein